ncbi:MAG TPA: lipoyl(octanoyl) transferase LipB [Methylomirabilota bacterium]|jgi:lipoyl(octanoyl) transferase|nr:lipoyl(octanoyl) transferase LipB [Methylomirabilota bacterium]
MGIMVEYHFSRTIVEDHGQGAIAGERNGVYTGQKAWEMVIYWTHLGLCAYPHALQVQYALHRHCVRTGQNALLLAEHPPVITLGYRRQRDHLRVDPTFLAERGIALVETERGGGATYHGPGQLIAYPLFSSLLRRLGVRRLMAGLEDVMCRVCRLSGAPAERRAGLPGAWVGEKKIGAVGIAVRRGASLHGCALNVNLDLLPFSYIIPCGLANVEVTSLQQETGRGIVMAAVESYFRQEFAAVFAAVLQEMPHEWCGAERETCSGALDYP